MPIIIAIYSYYADKRYYRTSEKKKREKGSSENLWETAVSYYCSIRRLNIW